MLTDGLGRTRGVARLTLAFGRLWPLLVAPLSVTGIYLAVSWFGLFRLMPDMLRLAVLALLGLALLASLLPLRHFRWPAGAEVDRHIERVNRLAHSPIRAQTERLAGAPDAFAEALWSEHKARLAGRLGRLSAGTPRTGLPDRDPWGLRAAVALLAVIAFAWSFGPSGGSVFDPWRMPAMAAAVPPRIDAWVTPPAYTGKAPVFLAARTDTLRVPEGSVLTARASGGDGGFALHLAAEDGTVVEAQRTEAGSDGAEQFAATLEGPAEAMLRDGNDILRSWRFEVVPDQPPKIEFAEEPRQALNGALELAYEVEDDYGIASAEARFELEQEGRPANARPLYDAPDFPLTPPRRKGQATRVSRDLTAHPWAGARVRLQLHAADDAGQHAASETRSFLLPQRSFSHPLARAIIEQRRVLALDANSRRRVLDMMDAILLWPEETIANAGHFLAVSVARRQLQHARSDEALRDVVDYLWEVARGIEDGGLSDAERRLLQAQQALRDALERGASDEEIERLMAELREALNDFLREFAERAMQDPNLSMQMPEGMEMSQSDLDRMLDQIEQLAKSGARDQAQQLLDQLQSMMNNLQAMRPNQGGDSAMRQQMDQLGEIMRRQQELMNETFRLDQLRRNGQPDRRGSERGDGQPGEMSAEEFAEAMRRLQEGQQQLQQDLGSLMEGLGELGIEPGEGFGEAGEHMDNAGRALGQGEGEQAVGEQGEALQALRRGAQDMMNQMQQQAGENGQGQGAQQGDRSRSDRDPLGRPRATTGPDFGDSVDVPDEIDVQRARRILEAIRKRLGDALSPQFEREYLERLLELR